MIGNRLSGYNNNKLVPSVTRHGVPPSNATCQTFGGNFQQHVANVVSQTVVDDFEVIQINKENRQFVTVASRHQQSLMDAIGKQIPIGEIGQSIMVGLIFELYFIFLAVSYVLQGLNDGHKLTIAIADRGCIEKDIAILSIEVLVPAFRLHPFRNEARFFEGTEIVRSLCQVTIYDDVRQNRMLECVKRLPGFILSEHGICLDAGKFFAGPVPDQNLMSRV